MHSRNSWLTELYQLFHSVFSKKLLEQCNSHYYKVTFGWLITFCIQLICYIFSFSYIKIFSRIATHKKRKDSLEARGELAVSCTMLRTKLYWNPFFFTVGFEDCLPFNMITISFFSFYCQDANKTGSNCAMINCILAVFQTQSRESYYIDYIRFLFNILLGNYLYNTLRTDIQVSWS